MAATASPVEDDLVDRSFKPGFIHVYLLGLALILSGPVGDWNSGLEGGLWSYFLEFMILSLAYLTLVLCLAEMTSIVAFASGAYGYVRCSVGPFYGYMVACCELLENSFVTITCAFAVSSAMTATTGLSRDFEPLWMLLCYVLLFAVQSQGGWYFWTSMCFFGATTVTLLILYSMSVLTTENLSRINLTNNSYEKFVGGGTGFFESFYRPMWLYIGTETMTISGKNMDNGPDVIPQVLIATVLTIFAVNVLIIFSTVIEYTNNGWFQHINDAFPLSFGLRDNLAVPYSVGAALTLAPNFASGLGFIYASMHLVQAMSLSGLVSAFFKPTVGKAKVPMRSLVTSCVVQYVVAVIGWAASDNPPFYQICVIAACCVYLGVFAAYATFHFKFANMERKFRSPLGLAGAAYGALIFGMTFFEIAIDTIDQYVVVVFVGIMLSAAAYYVMVVEARQFFSPEEQKRFMKAYILNANKKKKGGANTSGILERTGLANAMTWLTRFGGGSSMSSASQVSKASSQPSRAQASRAQSATKKNQVVAEPPLIAAVEDKAHEEIRPVATTTGAAVSSKARGFETATRSQKDPSFTPSRQTSLAWSGKVMDAASSQKFLQMITASSKPLAAVQDEAVDEINVLKSQFPDHFVVVEKSSDEEDDEADLAAIEGAVIVGDEEEGHVSSS